MLRIAAAQWIHKLHNIISTSEFNLSDSCYFHMYQYNYYIWNLTKLSDHLSNIIRTVLQELLNKYLRKSVKCFIISDRVSHQKWYMFFFEDNSDNCDHFVSNRYLLNSLNSFSSISDQNLSISIETNNHFLNVYIILNICLINL